MDQHTLLVPSRHSGPPHRILAAGTVVASCLTCAAGRHGHDCWAARQEQAVTSTARSIEPNDFQHTQPPIPVDRDRSLVAFEMTGVSQFEMNSRLDMILGQQAVMKEFFKKVMEPGTDYGVIPGVKKPMLFKSGAEKLVGLFGWAIGQPHVDEAYSAESGFYRARVELPIVARDNRIMGVGVGEANNNEARFRLRWVGDRFAKEEAARRDIDLAKLKTRHAGGRPGWTEYGFPNEDPFSQWNNVLKQAKNRALKDGAMACTRASGIFSRKDGIEAWLRQAGINTGWDDDGDEDDEPGPPRDVTPPEDDQEPLWKEGDEVPALVTNFEEGLKAAGLTLAQACKAMKAQWKPDRVLRWFDTTGYSVKEAVEFVAASK